MQNGIIAPDLYHGKPPPARPKHLNLLCDGVLATDTHFVSELLEHSSVRVTERFYIKRQQVEACRQALRVIEGGKRKAS